MRRKGRRRARRRAISLTHIILIACAVATTISIAVISASIGHRLKASSIEEFPEETVVVIQEEEKKLGSQFTGREKQEPEKSMDIRSSLDFEELMSTIAQKTNDQ